MRVGDYVELAGKLNFLIEREKTRLKIGKNNLEKIKEFGEESALQLGQQLEVIKKQYDTLLADTLTTGEAVGKMENMTRRGELGQKGLQNFISEVKNRLGGNVS